MTDQEPISSERHAERGIQSLMTPQATAIAGFAFSVFSMLGQGSWSMALSSLFWGDSYAVGAVGHVMAAWGIGCLLMAVAGAWLASRTLQVSVQGWDAHLARATFFVAGAGALFALLTIAGGLAHGS